MSSQPSRSFTSLPSVQIRPTASPNETSSSLLLAQPYSSTNSFQSAVQNGTSETLPSASSVPPSSGYSARLSGSSSASVTSKVMNVGKSGEPIKTVEFRKNGTQVGSDKQTQGISRGIRSHIGYYSKGVLAGTAATSGRARLPTLPLATAASGSAQDRFGSTKNVATMNTTAVGHPGTISSMLANTTPSNSTSNRASPSSSSTNVTSTDTFSNGTTLQGSVLANSTLSNSTLDNATLNGSLSSNTSLRISTLANSTLTNSTASGVPTTNLTLHISIKSNMNSSGTSSNLSLSANSTMYNTTLANLTSGNFWFFESGNLSIAVPFQPVMAPTLKTHAGYTGLQLLNQSTQCTSTTVVTKDIQKLTKTVVFTILVNETVTLYGDASIPLPVLLTPLDACSTNYLPFNPKSPGGGGTTTSTLLVTKKSPVIIRSPQTVGPIYNVPTTTAQAVQAQPAGAENNAEVPHSQQTTSGGHGSGGSISQGQSNSNGQVGGESSKDGLYPGSARLQQVYPERAPSEPSSGTNGKPSSGDSVQQPGEGKISGNGGQRVNGLQSPDAGSQAPNGEEGPENGGSSLDGGNSSGSSSHSPDVEGLSGNGAYVSTPGQTSGGGAQVQNGKQKPNGEGQTPGGGQHSGSGGHSASNGGQSAPESKENPSDSGQMTTGQSSSGQSNSHGLAPGLDITHSGTGTGSSADSQGQSGTATGGSAGSEGQSVTGAGTSGQGQSGTGTGSSTDNGEQSNHGNSAVPGENPPASGEPSQGNSDATDSYPDPQIPNTVTIDNVPVAIDSSAVVIGSQTIMAGSRTTVIANGQPIVVEPSQIVAPGTTIPIEAAVTSPLVVSTTIGSVPVVLEAHNIMIGSQTFSHTSSAAFAVYDGQTYSWDAKQLIGPGGTMVSFPSDSPAAPRVTAGGQVFSVYSSTLKASGTDVTIPNTPKASPFVYQGQTFSVNPSQLIAPDRSITIPPTTAPTPFVYNGQTFSVDSSRFIAPSATIPLSSGSGTVRYGTQVITIDQTRIICPSTTITLSSAPQDGLAATPSAITTGGLTFSLGPQAAVIGSSTYSFLPGQAPATITDGEQTIILGSSGIQLAGVNVPVPTIRPSYSAVTQGDITFSVAPSAVVLGDQTEHVQPSMAPVYTIVNGQTISIGTQGVGLASTTIPLPMPSPNYATVTEGDLTFSVAPSEAVFEGSTFAIGPNMPATMILGGQTVSVGPSEIRFFGTTVDLPTATNQEAPAAVTANGLTFSVGPTDAIIGGTSYAIGSDAIPKTVVVGSETLRLGTNGVILASTTFPPEQTPSAITADGLTFSADATEAIINGTAYAIGSEAIAKTIVVGSETIGLGTKGIVLPSTIIAPWGNATQTGDSSLYSTAAASGSLPTAAAATAPPPPTGLPGTDPEGIKNDVHHGAGPRLRPPDMLVLATLLGALISSLLSWI